MTTLLLKQQLQQEISLIPEQQVAELLKVIHYFRLGIESCEKNKPTQKPILEKTAIRDNPAFGMWQDIEENSRDYLQRIRQQQWA